MNVDCWLESMKGYLTTLCDTCSNQSMLLSTFDVEMVEVEKDFNQCKLIIKGEMSPMICASLGYKLFRSTLPNKRGV